MKFLSKKVVFCLVLFSAELASAQDILEVKEAGQTEEIKALTEHEIAKKLFGWSDEKVEKSKLMQQTVFEKYTNFSEAKKAQYIELVNEGNVHTSEGNFGAAYASFSKAEIISSGDYVLEFKLARALTQLRLFDEAEAYLLSALFKSPSNVSLRYNLGEVYFVSKKFDKATEQFLIVKKLTKFHKTEAVRLKQNVKENDLAFNIVDFVDFKLQLCYLGLKEKQQPASKDFLAYDAKYKELNKKFSKRAFTPLYYYSVALNLLNEGNEKDALNWARKSEAIFKDKSIRSSYIDALIEFGLLKSYYGGK